MNYKELTKISQVQNEVLMNTIETLKSSLNTQSQTLKSQSQTIASLTAEISELKKILLKKDKSLEAKAAQLNGLAKIALPKKRERHNYVDMTLTEKVSAPTPKERGNNGAKRKEYHNLEEVVEEVEPSHPEF